MLASGLLLWTGPESAGTEPGTFASVSEPDSIQRPSGGGAAGGALDRVRLGNARKRAWLRTNGFRTPPTDSSPQEVDTARFLRVEVIAADGTPYPGVPVTFGFLSRYGGGEPFEAHTVSAHSDEQGLASFDLDTVLEVESKPWSTEIFVEAEVIATQPPRAVLPLADLPGEPIRLQLPPAGSVRVEVVDGRGGQAHGSMRVKLQARPSGPEVPRVSEPVQEGRALFACVEIGRSLHASGSENWMEGVSFEGPKQVGQEVVARIGPRRNETALMGRLVDAGGVPLAHTRLQALYPKGRPSLAAADTDADGRFMVQGPDSTSGLKSCRIRESKRPGAPLRSVVASLPPLEQGDVHDLGVLVLLEPSVFASGQVVDGAGRGVPAAQVSLKQRLRGQEQSTFLEAILTDEGGRFCISEEATWAEFPPFDRKLQQVPQRVQVLLGEMFEAGQLCLTASKNGMHFGEPVVLRGDRKNVQLLLRREGSLNGRVIVPEPRPDRLYVYSREAHKQEAGFGHSREVEPDGSFSVPCPSGAVDLLVGTGNLHNLPLAAVHGIEVAEGEEVRDARLDPIGLSLQWIELELVNEFGEPIHACQFRIEQPTPKEVGHYHYPGRPTRYRLPRGPLTFAFDPSGFEPLVLEGVEHDVRVVLYSQD